MNRDILLLSYVFPPYPGIGGRRWAKFSKFLTKRGYHVHVICSENPFSENSNWMNDVKGNNHITIHYLPPRYPRILLERPYSFLEKLNYRLQLQKVKALTRGNYYERAVFWEAQIISVAGSIINKYGIKTVVSSGPPYHMLHHGIVLKEKHPGIRLISDFRDQWTDNKSFRAFSTLPPKRFAHEQKLEQDVLQGSDAVISVSEVMTENLKKRAPGSTAIFKTILNGFDPEDWNSQIHVEPDSQFIRMIFAGNLYSNLEKVLYPFLDMLARLDDTWKNKLIIDLYGSSSPEYEDYAKSRGISFIRFNPSIPLDQIVREVASSHYGLLFLNDDHTFSTSTKFMEYMALKKEVIVVSNPGPLQKFVLENKIGYAVRPEFCQSDFEQILKNHKMNSTQFNPAFNTSQYSLDSITTQLEALLS